VRRGPHARGVDAGLVRTASLLLLAPLLLLLFTTSRTGPLPAPALPPAFSAVSATQLTTELARDYPNRVPGSVGAARAEQWYGDTLALYGLTATADRWQEDVGGLGRKELVNLVTVIPGVVDDTIVVIAHRDNTGVSGGANDNASGTAALVELLRGYASTGTASRRLEPSHTLVFVSSDGGAFGALGAARFAAGPLARRAVAVLSLDGIAGSAKPRLELAGPVARSPAPSLVRTVTVRVGEQVGQAPAGPGLLTQLVDLGLPFGYGEQAPFLDAGRSAVRLSTAPNAEDEAGDEPDRLDAQRLGQLGRAAESTLASLDGAIQLSGRSAAFVYLGDRVARGWAIELLFLTALVPFAVAVIDLLVRALRRGTRLRGAWRDVRRRCGFALVVGGLVFLGALTGLFPSGGPIPPPADAPPVDSWPVAGLLLLAVAGAALAVRYRRLAAARTVAESDEVAGFTVAFATLGAISVVVAIANPFALVFLLPSLYTWLWLPSLRDRPGWTTDLLFGLGLAGPVLAIVVLASQLGLGLRTLLYAVGLATSGTTPWVLALCALLWAAVATHVAAIVSARVPAQPSDT
jgi:peptidase M28-like protein